MVDCLFGAGTSSTECSICHEEYASEEDVLRILKCGHRYRAAFMVPFGRTPAAVHCSGALLRLRLNHLLLMRLRNAMQVPCRVCRQVGAQLHERHQPGTSLPHVQCQHIQGLGSPSVHAVC